MATIVNFGSGKDSNGLINVNLKEFFNSFAAMPQWLKFLLCFSVIFCAFYFGYQKFTDNNKLGKLSNLTNYVEYLEEITSTRVAVEDYHKDYVHFYHEFALIRDLFMQSTETHRLELETIIAHLKDGSKDDKELARQLEHILVYYKNNMDNYLKKTSIDNNIKTPEDSYVQNPQIETKTDK